MSEQQDYLNPSRTYPNGQHEVVVSKTESTTPAVKDSLTTPLPFEPDEDEYGPEIYPPRTSFEKTLQAVKAWSIERGINGASPVSQMLKLTEEVGELAAAIARSQVAEAADAIGDTLVVLTILCQQLRLELPECFDLAYQTIKGRQGKTINGVFVKQNDIKEGGE